MKKIYTFLTAFVLTAAPEAMAITVDDLVGEYSTATDGKTKLTASGIIGTALDFKEYVTTVKKVDETTVLICNFANCNVDITAKVNLEEKTLEITDRTFPLTGIGFSFRPYAENDGKLTQDVEGTITGSFNDDATEIKIGKFGMFYGSSETSSWYCYGSSTLTPKKADGTALKTFTASYTIDGWSDYASGTCSVEVFENHFLLKDFMKEGKSIKFTYDDGDKTISMKDPVFTFGSPSYVNSGNGAWYTSYIADKDALVFYPEYKKCSYSIDDKGGKMIIYCEYYKNENDLKPAILFSTSIVWGEAASGIADVKCESLDNSNAIYNLQGMRVNAKNLKKGIYIVNGKKVWFE